MAEEYDVLVCMPAGEGVPLILPDNKIGVCAECGGTIQFRPNEPVAVRRLCGGCGFEELNARARAGQEVQVAIPEETVRYIKALMAAQRGKH